MSAPSHWTDKKEESSESIAAEQAQFSGELSVAELQHWINFVIERDRVNLGELNSVEELWMVVNNVVKETGWQPEETLKNAMLKALEAAITAQDAKWWQNHTKFLVKYVENGFFLRFMFTVNHMFRIWKKEVELETRSKTRVKLQLAAEPSETTIKHDAPEYVPPPHSPKIKRKTGKKALMELMGVGALLANVQKEAAENESHQTEATVQKDSTMDPKLKSDKPAKPLKKRRRRRSSCESGEASSTTAESDESETSLGPAASTHREEHKRTREKRKKKSDRRPTSTTNEPVAKIQPDTTTENDQRYASYAPTSCTNPATAATATMNPQTWMNQIMPTFMQMMPMMMQMSQMRMMSMANMTPQQQQQMVQLQQQMAQVSWNVDQMNEA